MHPLDVNIGYPVQNTEINNTNNNKENIES